MTFKKFLSEKLFDTIKTAHSDFCEVFKNPKSIKEVHADMWRGILVNGNIYVWDYKKGFHEAVWKRILVPSGIKENADAYGFCVSLKSEHWKKGTWIFSGGWTSTAGEFYDKEPVKESNMKVTNQEFKDNPNIVSLFGKMKRGTGDKRDMLYSPPKK